MDYQNKDAYLYGTRASGLRAGQVSQDHFRQLINISNIHSTKVILALEEFLVFGLTRQEACEKHHVAQGYFSISLRRLQELSAQVVLMYPHYAGVIQG